MPKYLKDFFGKTVSRMLWHKEGVGYFVGLRDQRKRPNRSEKVLKGAAIFSFKTSKAAEKFYNRFNTKENIREFLQSDSEEAVKGREYYAYYHQNKDKMTIL